MINTGRIRRNKSITKKLWQVRGWWYFTVIRSTCGLINKIAGDWKKTTATDMIYYCSRFTLRRQVRLVLFKINHKHSVSLVDLF